MNFLHETRKDCINRCNLFYILGGKIMKLKNVLLTCLSIMGVASLASCNQVNPNLTTEGVLVVGMECAYVPFNWTETVKTDTNVEISGQKGTYAEGYDVQIARIIADELDLKLEIKALSFDALINHLNSGLIDCIIAGMSPTPLRMESIDFTNKYYESTHVMLLKSSSTYASATSLDDFAGATIIGQSGTIYADLVSQAVEHGAVAGTNLATVPLIVNAINFGTVDATIVEEPVAMGIVSQNPDLTYVKLVDGGFEVAEEDKVVSIGVRKGFVLTDRINQILSDVITEEKRNSLMEQAISNAPTSEE